MYSFPDKFPILFELLMVEWDKSCNFYAISKMLDNVCKFNQKLHRISFFVIYYCLGQMLSILWVFCPISVVLVFWGYFYWLFLSHFTLSSQINCNCWLVWHYNWCIMHLFCASGYRLYAYSFSETSVAYFLSNQHFSRSKLCYVCPQT